MPNTPPRPASIDWLRFFAFCFMSLAYIAMVDSRYGCLADEKTAKTPEQKPTVDDLAWIAGSWITEGSKSVTEEIWLEPKSGLMLGCSRTAIPNRQPFFEFIRIQAVGDSIHYVAQPKGGPPTSFPVKSITKDQVVFENLEHDFPQRITYRKIGDNKLHAVVDGNMNGQDRKEEWMYVRK